ncbi:MAG: hypoxanthine phosphoribosyltransferase [Myxococcota bacterium]
MARCVIDTRERDIDVMISAEAIARRCAELGAEIARDFAGESLLVIGVLKGSFVFLADLVRHIDLDCGIDFLGVSSYGSRTKSSGVVRTTHDLSAPIKGRHVLLVEDIVDTGLTVKYLIDNMRTRQPRSVSVCSLLYKPANQKIEVPLDYVGFTIPDAFVVGYGLDFDESYRNLPYIGVVEGDFAHEEE